MHTMFVCIVLYARTLLTGTRILHTLYQFYISIINKSPLTKLVEQLYDCSSASFRCYRRTNYTGAVYALAD